MSQQGEQPTDAADDWWNRLYDESALDTGRPAARTDDAVDTLDDRFASATDAVAEPAPAEDPPPASPAPFTPSAPAPPSAPPPAPSARAAVLDEPSAASDPGAVRPRAWWEADPADTLDDPEFTAGEPSRSAEQPPPLARTTTVDLSPPPPPAPTRAPSPQPPPPAVAAPPRPPDPRRPADAAPARPGAGSPWDEPTPPPVSAPPVSKPSAGAPSVARARRPADVRPHPGYVGDGPPTYDAEPTALPAADPDAVEELVADTVLDGAHYGGLTLRAASLRGDSARYRGEPRRDALLTARFGTGNGALVLVVVATGARAAEGAHRAAADACRWIAAAVGRSHARLAEDIRAGRRGDLKSGLHRLTDRSLGKLRATAADLGVPPEEYTAALRCLLLPVDAQCRTRVFFGVGPGGLLRLREGEWQDVEPQPSEAAAPTAGGEPSTGPFRFRASVARPADVLLLCSTGLADPLRDEPALTAELATRWGVDEPPGLAAFLADVQLRVKGYADDRTAVAVWESAEATGRAGG